MSFQFCRILSTAQLRALEASWIKSAHQNWGLVLMEVAGLSAAQVAATMYEGNGFDEGVVVVCGSGNNGGDGYVVARNLLRWGISTTIYVIGEPKEGSEAEVNKQLLESTGGRIIPLSDSNLTEFADAMQSSALIVDALLGTGLDRDVEGLYASAIDWMMFSGRPILSIDIPSGINSDSGQVMHNAVRADATVTFGHLKGGLLHYPGADHAGEIVLIDIGLPFGNYIGQEDWHLANYQQVARWLPVRHADAHKGSMGRLLSVAGSSSMTGAAMMAARSALRTGVGVSVLATAKSVIHSLPPEEIIYRSLSETGSGTIAPPALSELESDLEQASAVLLGPGLSTNNETIHFVHDFVRSLKKPSIIDADALNAIAHPKKTSFGNPSEMVFTPHPKELSRLLGISVGDIQSDRIGAAEKARDRFGCNIVLKGARTVVATVDGATWIIPCGNPGMATAGSGDVLSGIIGSLLAQGVHAPHAAVAGAYIHAAAGDYAADSYGEDGMVASNITEALPMVLADIRSDEFTGTDLEQMVLSL